MKAITINTFCKNRGRCTGAISFLSNPKYTHYIYDTKSSVVLVDRALILDKPVEATIIRVANARDCVAKLLNITAAMRPKKNGINSLAFISPTAQIGKDVYIGAYACMGDGAVVGDGCQIYPNTVIGDNVKLGNDCIIYPNVTVYMGCKLGNRITLHSGSVIGANGFGFAPNGKRWI